jgi:hypothetical protein
MALAALPAIAFSNFNRLKNNLIPPADKAPGHAFVLES